MTANKQVVRILGTSFCGSTLLNHLLDTQPTIRGLNEAWHWFNPKTTAFCAKCLVTVNRCRSSVLLGDDNFWADAFACYPETEVLVDASKHPSLMVDYMPPVPAEYPTSHFVLSKLPHEFAWSYTRHSLTEVGLAFVRWVEVYKCIRDFACERLDPIVTLNYVELASKPGETIRKLCEHLSVTFDEVACADPWGREITTCMLGGNNAVYAQVDKGSNLFDDPTYLSGKYLGKRGQVFLDEQWKTDLVFVAKCLDYYRSPQFMGTINELLNFLGYTKTVDDYISELTEIGKDIST